MSKQQMIINYAPGEECRIAIVEDGRLEELHSERAGSVSFVGNIYVGRVTNVEPSIQAAFVDFGLESNGFLHISDVHPQYFPGADDETAEQIGRKTPRRERPPIQQCLRRGQEVIVQVLKEGISTKGPTLTSYLSIPGRYLVMLPNMDRVGVSRKVEDDEQRREMKQALDQLDLPEGFGFIMRTAGEGRGKMELKRDLAYLQRLWKDIERRRRQGDKPRLLYAESDLLMRALRDIWTSEISEIVIDNESALNRAARFMKIVSPRSGTKLLHYDRATPIFHAYGIEEQILRTHAREVPLPSGGSLVVDETEAMVAIDVNSGKMRHHGDAETTAYKTNIEAVDEICRQLRLRDVGGLVLCDLIDMMKRDHRRDIENRFKERLKRDRSATKVLPISQFGIVEMTRQRQKGSLRATHYAKCPSCIGRGVLKRPDSVADDAMRDLAALLEHEKVVKVELVVSPRVAGELLSKKRQHLGRMEHELRKHVDVRVSEDIEIDRVNFFAYDGAGADIEIERLPRPKAPKDLPVWAELSGAPEDWSLDMSREEHEASEPPPVQIGPGVEDELLLSEDLDVPEDEGDEAPAVSSGGRRRRRRGRGRKGAAAEPAGAASGAPPAPADGAPSTSGTGTPIFSSGEQDGSAGEAGGGRRRRRRRRGRGRSRDLQPAATLPAPVDEGSGAPRGDSWDLAPAEFAPGAQPSETDESADQTPRQDSWDLPPAMLGAPSAPDAESDDESDDDLPSARELIESEPEGSSAERDDDGHESQSGRDGAEPGEGGGKKRRRRRRRRGGGGGAGARSDGDAPQKSAPAQKPSGQPRDSAGGRTKPASAPIREPKTQSAPPPKPPPGIVSPTRLLYGSRRRISPNEAARVKRDE